MDHTEIHLTGCEFEGLHKLQKCKVGPKFVKGRYVLLPYGCSKTNIQIWTYKYTNTDMQIPLTNMLVRKYIEAISNMQLLWKAKLAQSLWKAAMCCCHTDVQIKIYIYEYRYKCTNIDMQIHIDKYASRQIQWGNFKYNTAAMKCKVGPKFVKGSNVLLPYRWSLMEYMSKLHQLAQQPIHGQIFKILTIF